MEYYSMACSGCLHSYENESQGGEGPSSLCSFVVWYLSSEEKKNWFDRRLHNQDSSVMERGKVIVDVLVRGNRAHACAVNARTNKATCKYCLKEKNKKTKKSVWYLKQITFFITSSVLHFTLREPNWNLKMTLVGTFRTNMSWHNVTCMCEQLNTFRCHCICRVVWCKKIVKSAT